MSRSRGPERGRARTPRAGTHGTGTTTAPARGLHLLWWLLPLLVVAGVVFWLTRREERPPFSGERALEDIARQVAFGPRVPGTEAHARTRQFLVDSLGQYADRVSQQTFTYTDPADSSRIYEGTNIIASFNLAPESGRRVMLAAHWDTRAISDQDPDPANRTKPTPGANDGGSGVAVLLEMARVMNDNDPAVGVDLVFFDLEDLGREAERGDSTVLAVPYAIGSRYFAANSNGYAPAYGILLDIVCDRNLRLPKEGYSVRYAKDVVDKVWRAADRVGAGAFVDEAGAAIYDDHVPLLERGIPVIDLIQHPFPSYWHTTADTPDKCSAASLEQVGNVLIEVIYSEK